MPAGRVDLGEGIATGAVREALEEAGVDVTLKNFIRVDFTPSAQGTRLRQTVQGYALLVSVWLPHKIYR